MYSCVGERRCAEPRHCRDTEPDHEARVSHGKVALPNRADQWNLRRVTDGCEMRLARLTGARRADQASACGPSGGASPWFSDGGMHAWLPASCRPHSSVPARVMTDTTPSVLYWQNQASPYMVSRFNTVQSRGNIRLEAIFSRMRAPDRDWTLDPSSWHFEHRTLSGAGHQRSAAVVLQLRRKRPD